MLFRLIGAVAGMAFAACASAPQAKAPGGARVDIGITFEDLNEAAKAACQWIWDHEPKAQKWEYCGALYEGEDGIRVTIPITMYGGTCGSPAGPPHAPEGTLLLGKYHSHRFEPEPSGGDLRIAKKYPSLGLFLCAPSRIVRRFSTEGTVIVK